LEKMKPKNEAIMNEKNHEIASGVD
jgi:hypothetical protein